MDISANYQNGILYVCLRGEIDEHGAAKARRYADGLAERYTDSQRAVFDLSGVSFMDSTGIGFLIGRYKKFNRYGIPMYVTKPSESTDRILLMSGVYTLTPRI